MGGVLTCGRCGTDIHVEQTAVRKPQEHRPAAAAGRDPRHRVSLSVRFANAHTYVEEYAENLSRGGLFVVGAHQLNVLDLVMVQIDLPGFGRYEVGAEVAHILTPEIAAKVGRRPGAGFAIRQAPEGFREALTAYLVRLGARRNAMVFCTSGLLAAVIKEAGFVVEPLPELWGLLDAVRGADKMVVGIFVPPDQVAVCASMLEGTAWESVIVPHLPTLTLDDVLNRLDEAVVLLPMLL